MKSRLAGKLEDEKHKFLKVTTDMLHIKNYHNDEAVLFQGVPIRSDALI